MKIRNLKKTFALATSALALSAAFVGCSDYSEFTAGELQHELDVQKYNEAFVAMYGEIDPNHDWGMNENIGFIQALSSKSTRSGYVDVNRNQWTDWNTDNSKGPIGTRTDHWDHAYGNVDVIVPYYKEDALGHDILIPGWPHLNGLYYNANGNVLAQNCPLEGREVTSGMIPAGDITPYEIQYVSAWFRTHKNPQEYNIKLHLSDFFIQNVSCDYDQVEYNELNPDAPYKAGWEKTGKNGYNISTAAQARNHKAWDGSDYAPSDLQENINYDLDNLGFMDMDEVWTHVNNFNRGNSNFSPEDNDNNPNREIKLITSSGTEKFHCHPTWCTETEFIDDYVLVHLTWNETVKDPKSPYYNASNPVVIPREGYYLAFDFNGTKSGKTIKRDGYYSNWIIKITPAHFNPAGNARRIFCEDLGGSVDNDFNDAVVDVAFVKNQSGKYNALINVQAAGGTMPVYVEKNDSRYELHKMLGGEGYKQINVDDSRFTPRPPAIYRGTKEYSSTEPKNVQITVKNTVNGRTYDLVGSGNVDGYGNDRTESLVEGTYNSKADVAPRAFSAPVTVKWTKEDKPIHTAYQDFVKWVGNKDWLASGSNAHWYSTKTDEANLLYTPVYKSEDDNPTNTGEGEPAISWVDLTPDASVKDLVAKVNADSYMRLNDYTGVDAIKTKLNGMNDEGRVTFVVVMSSTKDFSDGSLQGVLVPADIDTKTEGGATTYSTSNNGTTFSIASSSRFNTAVYAGKSDEFGSGTKTNTLQFSLAKKDIINSTHTDSENAKYNTDKPYHDYLLLYLKNGSNVGNISDVKIEKWYVHY